MGGIRATMFPYLKSTVDLRVDLRALNPEDLVILQGFTLHFTETDSKLKAARYLLSNLFRCSRKSPGIRCLEESFLSLSVTSESLIYFEQSMWGKPSMSIPKEFPVRQNSHSEVLLVLGGWVVAA